MRAGSGRSPACVFVGKEALRVHARQEIEDYGRAPLPEERCLEDAGAADAGVGEEQVVLEAVPLPVYAFDFDLGRQADALQAEQGGVFRQAQRRQGGLGRKDLAPQALGQGKAKPRCARARAGRRAQGNHEVPCLEACAVFRPAPDARARDLDVLGRKGALNAELEGALPADAREQGAHQGAGLGLEKVLPAPRSSQGR